ncbi:hypothetical protein MCOR25_011171 [Pyricularia grisea]|nr:hypothetical protein MCOR25_011171 [Pyricularia grisea]
MLIQNVRLQTWCFHQEASPARRKAAMDSQLPHLGKLTSCETRRTVGTATHISRETLGNKTSSPPTCKLCALSDLRLDRPDTVPTPADRIFFVRAESGLLVRTAGDFRMMGEHTVDSFTMEGSPPCDLWFFFHARKAREDTWASSVKRLMNLCER